MNRHYNVLAFSLTLIEMKNWDTGSATFVLNTSLYTFFFPSKSLFDIVNKIHQMINSGKLGSTVKPKSLVTSSAGGARAVQEKPFDAMNNIIANLLLNLTR